MVHASAPPTLTAPGAEATARVAAAVAAPVTMLPGGARTIRSALNGSNQL